MIFDEQRAEFFKVRVAETGFDLNQWKICVRKNQKRNSDEREKHSERKMGVREK